MDAPEQARAYAGADFSEANALFVERLTPRLAALPAGSLIDLGCGPGDICLRLAAALPRWRIVGLDAGPNMLALARRALGDAGMAARVELVHARLPRHGLDTRFEAVVSNSLLHHLPDPAVLWRALAELAAPGAWIQVMDLHRPDSERQVRHLVGEHAADAPQVLRRDFHNSLKAAWTAAEIERQLADAGLEQLELTRPSDRHWLVEGRI